MKTLEVANAIRPLSEYAKSLEEEILVLTSKTIPIAAIVSLKNVDWESLSLSTNPEFMKIIEMSREEFNIGKRLSLEEMQQEISTMDAKKK
ncbi:MAG: hypothetical protein QME42_03145 [bacterium]|nr:hypothetical protein [bacterium]